MKDDILDKEQLLSYIFNYVKEHKNYNYFDQEYGDGKINDVTSYYYGYEIKLKNNMCVFIFKSIPRAIKIGVGDFLIKSTEDKILHQIQIIQRSIYDANEEFYLKAISKEEFEKFDNYLKKCDNEFAKMIKYKRSDGLINDLNSKLFSTIRKDKIKKVLED